MTNKKKLLLFNYIPFMILLFIYLAVTLFLFHRQTVLYDGRYVSDVLPYVAEMQGIDTGYDFPYPVLFSLGKFFMFFTTPVHAMAFAITLLNGLTCFIIKYYFDKLVQTEDIKRQLWGYLGSTIMTFSLLFVSMLFPLNWLGQYHPLGEDYLYRYLGVFTPNPYHNATFLAARPFTIPVLFLFMDLAACYRQDKKYVNIKYILFSLFLLLSTLTKPSFTLIFVAMAGLVMLFHLIIGRFHEIKAFFGLGVWFIPTFLVLLYQFGNVFTPEKNLDKGIGFGFMTAWSTICDNIPLAILRGIAFPLTVLFFSILTKKVSRELKYAWGLYGMGLFTLAILYEKGFRLNHVNFSWGYMHGLFFLFMVSLMVLYKDTCHKKQPTWQLSLQWVMYGLHLICGVDYFLVLLKGGLFH